jgi:hypothetical protein
MIMLPGSFITIMQPTRNREDSVAEATPEFLEN